MTFIRELMDDCVEIFDGFFWKSFGGRRVDIDLKSCLDSGAGNFFSLFFFEFRGRGMCASSRDYDDCRFKQSVFCSRNRAQGLGYCFL